MFAGVIICLLLVTELLLQLQDAIAREGSGHREIFTTHKKLEKTRRWRKLQ
jgi:hypothetical protein